MTIAASQTWKPVHAATAPFRSNGVTTSSFSKMCLFKLMLITTLCVSPTTALLFQSHSMRAGWFKKPALYSTPTPNADAGDNPDGAGDDANADGNGDEDPAFQFPIDELRAHFQEHMVRPGSNTVLKDWATYETTLPVRKESGRYLAQFSYWAADDDLKYILKQLETPVDDPRALLGYISAQSGAGKSACVLPIFLQSRRTNVNDKKFTHYIHLPFDNNYDNHFQSDDYQDELGRPKPGIRACKAHGAAFMHKVLQLFLRGENDANGNLEVPKYNQRIPINTDAPDTGVTQKLINKLINDVFLPGSRILFHVDEHRKANDNPYFRRGAFEALAKIPNCKCIATYIDIPYEIHRRGTSTVSRLPLPLPALDLNKMFTTHPELDFARHLNLTPPARSNQECQRQMATLKCRVAFLISQCFGEFHNGRLRETLVDKLREAIAKVEKTNNTQGRLHGPSEVTDILREFAKALETIQEGYNLNISLDSRRHDNLLKLMTGYTEDDIDTLDNRLRPPLAVVANRIFASWKPLFQLQSFDCEPFNIAKSLFTAVAFKKKSIDDLSATPLERAYLWSLLCYFQQDGKINFNDHTGEKSGDELHDDLIVNFKANNFKFGRLFLGPQSTDGCMINPTILEKDILYVVAEKDVAGKGDAGKGDAENSVADNGDPKHSDAGKGVAEKSVNKKTDAVAKLWQFRLIRLGDANNKKGAVVWRNP
mmetsp:Transcript_12175/g.35327  ORF Transcript_12175/g.35327 Transcript_12175/m.35327 type:complete len:710 (-) Transcript_12175:564-2693(-)